jgi:hypothetical protein
MGAKRTPILRNARLPHSLATATFTPTFAARNAVIANALAEDETEAFRNAPPSRQKVFGSFFQKRTASFTLPS